MAYLSQVTLPNNAVYNLKDSRVYSVDKIFDFIVSGNKVYGLGFYKDNPENVRLFEIWK